MDLDQEFTNSTFENENKSYENIVKSVNEEVNSVRPFIEEFNLGDEDHVVPRRSIFQYLIQGSKQSFDRKNHFSSIKDCLLNVNQWNKLLNWNIKSLNGQWNILYKATRHGFNVKHFHNLCDNKGPTITIIRTRQGRIFGGYTRVSWHSDKCHFSCDPSAFLFSFSSNSSIKYSLIDKNCPYAIWNAPNYGPTFGRGADLFICSQSDLIEESYSKLSSSYRDPTGLGDKALAGQQQFYIDEIEKKEVFPIVLDMLEEEKPPSSTSLVVHLIIVGFHHKKGHQIEYSYPLLHEPIDDRWSNLGSLAIPDGAHNRENDLIYFHLPSLNDEDDYHNTLFCVASYRQIDANSVTNKEADVTRNSIQKSVCLLLRRPVYGNVSEELKLITEKYFQEKDFNKTKMFEEFVNNLNLNPPTFNLEFYSARDFVIQYRRKALILFKLILLQKKVLFMVTPIENLVKTIITLVSLIPDLVSDGLNSCTLIGEESNIESEISLNESEDIVFDRNDDKQLDFDGIKLKTLKSDDEEEESSSTLSIEEEVKSSDQEELKNNLLKRATSITNKLSSTFNRMTSATNPSMTINCSQDLSHLDQFQFPLQLFKKNHVLHPYVSIHSLDLINNSNIRSYMIGASNQLFRQQNTHHFILNDNEEEFIIQSSDLRQQLQLTTADLRFTQLFEDGQSNIKTEQEIRRLFTNYLLSLLAVARTPNEEAINDFNSSFVKAFQSTDAFRIWQSKGPYPHFDQIVPRHPQAGQLNVTDVKLRVSHVLDDTETGRKLKGAFEDTSQFMGEKSRAATKVLGQAKNSLFTSVLGTFNQGKQWLSKPQPSSD